MEEEELQKRTELFDSYKDRIKDENTKECIRHTFLDYTRTPRAEKVFATLEKIEDMRKLSVVDYGCGVGDYGFYFAGKGSKATFYDFQPHLDFVKYRFSFTKPEIEPSYVSVKEGLKDFEKYSLIIFGEVLEHLEKPLDVLKECLKGRVKYLFTTCYPYVFDNHEYFLQAGHLLSAEAQQEDCRKLLEDNYEQIGHYRGALFLWRIK